jgi:hypothetical protein
MRIKIEHLTYGSIQDRVDWLSKNVGERKYVLHNQSGGLGWRYYTHDRTLEIEDEQLAMLFILKFGG